MNWMIRAFALTSLLVVTGCSTSSLLTSSEPQQAIYSLRPAPKQNAVGGTGIARVVEIPPPAVPPGFDTDRIALYMEEGHRVDYFAGAKWPTILDDVIQDFTRRTATNVVPSVVAITPSQSIKADFSLHVKVNEFQPVYASSANQPPRLMVEIEFTLLAMPEETIVSSFTLSRQGEATSNRLDVVTAGLEKMLQEIEGEAFTRMAPYLKKAAK